MGVNVDKNYISLPGNDSITTNLIRLETGWHLSPWASFNGNIQYDDESEIVGLFARFRWIIRPGNDLFFVYTHNWLNEEELGFRTMSRGGTTKINYTYRF